MVAFCNGVLVMVLAVVLEMVLEMVLVSVSSTRVCATSLYT